MGACGSFTGMKNRGQKATEEQKRQLVSALSVLEAHGGVPAPVQVRTYI